MAKKSNISDLSFQDRLSVGVFFTLFSNLHERYSLMSPDARSYIKSISDLSFCDLDLNTQFN